MHSSVRTFFSGARMRHRFNHILRGLQHTVKVTGLVRGCLFDGFSQVPSALKVSLTHTSLTEILPVGIHF